MLSPAIIVAAALVVLAAGQTGSWYTIDDFESRGRAWTADGGAPGALQVAAAPGNVGGHALAVTLTRQTSVMVRATWQVDVSDLQLSARSRVRLRLFGSPLARNPHGGLIAVESGGGPSGADSHWIAPIDGHVYGNDVWQTIELPPLSEFTQTSWNPDADGKLDPARISSFLFVAQQETSPDLCHPYTVYVDDVEVSNAGPRSARTVPAADAPPAAVVRPKLRGFVDRSRAHAAQVTFGEVRGWTVDLFGAPTASLERTDEEPLFDKYAARLTYASKSGGWIVVKPPKPIELPSRWNAIDLWVFGNNWDWVPDPTTPQPEIAVTVVDRSGEVHRLDLGRVNWKFWGLLHKLVLRDPSRDEVHSYRGGDQNGQIDGPARFTSIEIRNISAPADRRLYFDSVAFYQEDEPRPRLKPAHGRLSFPSTPTTIVPPPTGAVHISATQQGDTFQLSAVNGKRIVRYTYRPRTGTLSDLIAAVAGREFHPAMDAGPIWRAGSDTVGPGDSRIQRKLLSVRLDGGTVRTRWRWVLDRRSVEFSLSLRVVGRSLVHEWQCETSALSGLSLGRATGLRAGRLIRVPYYAFMGRSGGAGIMMDGGLFESHLVDWYVTDCSAFEGGAAEISPSEVACAGSLTYNPLTDGTRNPLRERCVLTVSDRFDEVLPRVPNPPSPNTAILRNYMYTHVGGTSPDRFDRWLESLRTYARYGIDHLIVTQHEDSWTQGADVGQGPEEYTMTTQPPPDVPGGEAAMQHYYGEVRKLGHYVGPYNNYTDYSPLGASWDERNVTRLSNGQWQRSWPPTFNIRPLMAAAMAEHYAPAQAAKYGVNATYCDVHTCVAPWTFVDYQAGLPGAGKMRTTYEAYGRLLLGQREAFHGPVFSEGSHHCFYAGLLDGSYGQMALSDPPHQPLLLDFDLLRLHPLGADISMVPAADWSADEYHCMATTIAYGHAGFFPFGEVPRSCRYYYMMGALQRRMVQVAVRDIRYWDGARFLDISHALLADANKRGQVRVRYANGLDVWVNCNPTESWSVEVDGRAYDLPPYGWVARNGDEFLTYSALVEGRRVGFVRGAELLFADPGDRPHDFGSIAASGMVAIKIAADGARKLFAITATGDVRFGSEVVRTHPDIVSYDLARAESSAR